MARKAATTAARLNLSRPQDMSMLASPPKTTRKALRPRHFRTGATAPTFGVS
eukprot:CAMPEP_0119564696 /NCGR_PEP_ID=MMETSP1352-20130426/27742_1 /TAXON_ID=265584 /ORGANISM="Stauroneis constricta, Strain CCMP1120" /LENGTH=51 /DNA_ID=CAMNT_0007613471 /DNA_START=8 /DNA_END=159 /DNA_ORIENTATION=-